MLVAHWHPFPLHVSITRAESQRHTFDMPMKISRMLMDSRNLAVLHRYEIQIWHLTVNHTFPVFGSTKFSFLSQEIAYDGDMAQIEAVVNRSSGCKQYIEYKCRQSRLFNSPCKLNEYANIFDKIKNFNIHNPEFLEPQTKSMIRSVRTVGGLVDSISPWTTGVMLLREVENVNVDY